MKKFISDSKMYCPLSKTQGRKWRRHFNQKVLFYKEKEAQEYLMWPKKFVNQSDAKKDKLKKRRTFRNIRRKEKKIKEKADMILADGDVRILVDLEVPPEAIAVLGKGLGYVPTPSLDSIETRLDARQVTNKITYLASRSNTVEANDEENERLSCTL